jgi:CRP/FNR family transcriptional regulator, cyclic AMP receptor protein
MSTAFGRLYTHGEIIIKQGTLGDCLFVIQEGKVEVIDETGGKETKVAELGDKEFFGEMGLFEKDVRSCTVRAVGDTRLLTIDKQNFIATIQKDPSLAFRLLESMSRRLRNTTRELGALKQRVESELETSILASTDHE